jgi:cytoskeletal protein RodZ
MAWMRNRDNSGGQRDYLNAEDTAGRPMALASILFTLLFIAAIVLLLFSAGRWAYNQMIDEEVTVTTTQLESANNDTSNGNVTVESGANTQTTEASADITSPQNNVASEPASTPTTPSETTVATTTTAAVPNTGPGSLLSVFAVSTLLATVLHYRYQLRKNR